MERYIKSTLFTSEQIVEQCHRLANEINTDYKGRDVVIVSVLRGAVPFTVDMCRLFCFDHKVEYIAVSSYGDSTESSGPAGVKVISDLRESIEGKHVLIIEDIIDTGYCLNFLVGMLKQRNPASLEICVCIDKKHHRKANVPCKYIGFTITGPEWLVGYGLDLSGYLRSLPYIGILDQERITSEANTTDTTKASD